MYANRPLSVGLSR